MKRTVLAALVVAVMVGAVMCGGTTGTEDLPAVMTSNPMTVDGGIDATVDATLDETPDAGFFDVDIVYADRRIPDVAAPTVTGDAAAGYPWPNCPPWVPVRFNGILATLDTLYKLIPAEYDDAGSPLVDDAGRAVPYPDGSACATYPWLGSTAADSCLASSGRLDGYSYFPPCNWCVDAGVTLQGPLSGTDRYAVCAQLYECMMRTGCGQNNIPGYCLCGSDHNHCDAGGPCGFYELASLESLSDPASLAMAIQGYTDLTPKPGYCAAALNKIFANGVNDQCYSDAGQ